MDAPHWPIIKDVVLFVIAIYGAILSTFNWRQAIRRDSRQITVTTSTVMPTYGSEVGAPFAKLEAINTGHRVVTIKTITFELPNRSRFATIEANRFPWMHDTPLPATLTDGQSAFLIMPYSDIANALLHNKLTGITKLTPVCVDTADNVYRGKAWDVDPHEFMRMGV